MTKTVKTAKQAKRRCAWAEKTDIEAFYHDTEWGRPLRDGRALWECLMLEGFQAGLSWVTVLRKREAFRKAFAGFDPVKVAKFTEKDIDRLMQNEGIIRARKKIEATIAGARIYLEMQKNGEDFAGFCWSFTKGKTLKGDGKPLPPQTPLSVEISKALKKRGFKFVGPTIVYAWMQAVGIVNDHAEYCFCRNKK